jgi:hypothetical protein
MWELIKIVLVRTRVTRDVLVLPGEKIIFFHVCIQVDLSYNSERQLLLRRRMSTATKIADPPEEQEKKSPADYFGPGWEYIGQRFPYVGSFNLCSKNHLSFHMSNQYLITYQQKPARP